MLRALCAHTELARVRTAVARLADYDWSEPDHAVVFGAIRNVAELRATMTRDTLSLLATRAGFPDLELEGYFVPRDVGTVEAAVDALLTSGK